MRRVAASVTRQISVATLALVLAIVAAAVIVVVWQLQPSELAERQRPGETKIYVDARAVLVALGIIGVGAVVFAAVMSWVIAQRAVRPLGRALRLQRDFVADASHELRTPLAVLDARLQLLQRRLGTNDPSAATLADLRADTAALIEIVNELLAAAGGDDERGATTDAATVLTVAADALRLLAARRAIELVVTAPPGVRVALADVAFRRCVTALVDNAMAHSPNGGRIEIALTASDSQVELAVMDHGQGIRGIDPARVFDRFAHSSPETIEGLPRRRGFGIGLALVRDVAVRNGGSVRIERTGSGGTVIVLELPRA